MFFGHNFNVLMCFGHIVFNSSVRFAGVLVGCVGFAAF